MKFIVNFFGLHEKINKLNRFTNELKYSGTRHRIEYLSLLLKVRAVEGLVRYGSKNDGGYVILNRFEKVEFLLSLGVADNVDFEEDLGKQISNLHLYDDSINRLPRLIKNAKFFQNRITPTPSKKGKTLSECLLNFPKDSEGILKIDIEGSEWEVLLNAPFEELSRFQQIVGEFHGLHSINSEIESFKMISVFEKLNITHSLVSLHANNWGSYEIIQNFPLPDVVEVCYVRNDLIGKNLLNNSRDEIASPNNPLKPDIALSFG